MKRVRERSGLNKKSIPRIINKIYAEGLTQNDITGKLKEWATHICLNNNPADEIRIYGNNIYLFTNNYFITMFQIPKPLLKGLDTNKRIRAKANNKETLL